MCCNLECSEQDRKADLHIGNSVNATITIHSVQVLQELEMTSKLEKKKAGDSCTCAFPFLWRNQLIIPSEHRKGKGTH